MKQIQLFHRLIWKPVIILAGLLLASGLVLTLVRGQEEADAPSPMRGQALPNDAEIYEIETVVERQQVAVTGTLTSDHYVTLSARIGAHVVELAANAGDSVEAGELLIRLDDRELKANDVAAEANLHQARTQFERVRALYEQTLVSEQEFIAAEAAFQTATAQREQAAVQLQYAHIKAPIDGIVIDRLIEVGDFVQPGQALALLYDPTQLRFDVQIPARWIPHVNRDDTVSIDIGSPPQSLTGEILRIRADVDAATRTRLVQVRIPHSEELLVPGTFGRLLFDTEAREVIRVPTQAIRRVGQIEQVRVVEDNRLHVRLIKTGDQTDEYTEVLAGLQIGERILIAP